MVATIDGKTLSGGRDEHVLDLGSKVDHELMDRLEGAADAILIGANSARANPAAWNPNCPVRMVATRSGDIPWESRYFTGGKAYAVCPEESAAMPPPPIEALRFGKDAIDWPAALSAMRRRLGIDRLHVMGGSELNADLLRADVVDELFLTVAPMVKLGRNVPTYAGGEPLQRQELLKFDLVSHFAVDNELFLRYRRMR